MQENKEIERIKSLCKARAWTSYRLAKESGITYSTLCTMLHKASAPSIPTLTKICNGFGITLSQFFDEEDIRAYLTAEDIAHLQSWQHLTEENQQHVQAYINYLLCCQE